LFGESASRVVVSVTPDAATEVLKRAKTAGVPARVIGRTGGQELRVAVGGQLAIAVGVSEAERVWSGAVEHYFAKQVA
jgi:phosphoribosylformylglycinamidine synthase